MELTADELAPRLGDETLTILDVRTWDEFAGVGGYACDPRQGHIPGARHIALAELLASSPMQVRERVGLPEGAEIVAYCHSGQRSALATSVLLAAGYDASNYAGSWHEWSRRDDLPVVSS